MGPERDPGGPRRVRAFAPGRVNLIGEHTDYNEGLALPFAIGAGVRVTAERLSADDAGGRAGGPPVIVAVARDLGESDEFVPGAAEPERGWRGFVRGVAAELAAGGLDLPGARLQIEGDLARGAGLSSSAALAVAVALALVEVAGPDGAAAARDPVELARLCSRVENEWVGARTGLLDQLASLCGQEGHALRIDFRSLELEPVPLVLGDWHLALLDSGERHEHASSGYNERRNECARACELLGVRSLREAGADAIAGLPEPLARRALHVAGENRRVSEAGRALHAGALEAVGELLDQSHASLRDLFEISTPRVEETVASMRATGAAGARLMGGGFGGSVLGLFGPGAQPPPGSREVRPGPGAHVAAAI